MIEKLQRKFILLSMAAFLAVLVVIIAGINIINYNSVVTEADQLLTILAENKGTFPDMNSMGIPPQDHTLPGGTPPDIALPESTPPVGDALAPFPENAPSHHGFSPETPYESRYFSVILNNDDGSVLQVETSRVVSVDNTQAIAYADDIISDGLKKGFLDNYRYVVRAEGEFTRITFLDWGRKLDSFWNFLLTSIIISLIGYLVVFILIAFFSRRIIQPISESYEKQKRFITDAGHEIKTPLTIINADADVLEMELGENEFLQDIQKQAKRLTDLTNDLVMLSRMEENNTTLSMIEFPISDLISETAASFQALAQTQNKDLELHIQPLLSLKGNEKSITQLVHILLDNGLKYSPVGGAVSLKLEKQGKYIRLSVYNTTIDEMSAEALPHLFDRFYRLDSSRNSQTGGHGIGLSVAKAIVSSHGGKIQATTTDGSSLLITVLLPDSSSSR